MEIRAAKPTELDELVELQCRVFRPKERAEARYWSYFKEDLSYRLDQARVVIDQGRIVSHLRIWDRKIRVRGVALRAGGIGSLLTRPESRGLGHASALMRETVSYMAREGYDLGLLFTVMGPAFYERLGWSAIPLPTFEIVLGKGLKVPAPGEGVRRVRIEKDLEAVMEIYAHYCEGMTGPEVRPRSYWTSGPSRYRGVFPGWGYEAEGRLLAYLNYEVEPNRIWVKEACVRPGSEKAFLELGSAMLAEAMDRGIERVGGSLPKGHVLVDSLAAVAQAPPAWGLHSKMMVRTIDWESLTERFGGGEKPARPKSDSEFWHAFLGLTQIETGWSFARWMKGLPECEEAFYWSSDVF